MRALDTTATLTGFERRGPGTDAERRAARWLARGLRTEGHRVAIEPFWCRPNWALAHAWHVALALAGGLLSVSHATVGALLLATALISIAADVLIGVSPGRRLTPERASQNVVATTATPAPATENANAKPVRLIVTSNYDAGRTALVYRDAFRRPAARLRRAAGPFALGWLAALSLAITWLLAIAVIRIVVLHPGSALGAIQLAPSVALVLALALLLEAAGAGYGAAAGDNATGASAAIALVGALSAAPPRNLAPELLLQGAGEGQEIGMRRYLRAHKRDVRPDTAIVLGIAASGAGQPHYWRSDGQLIPIRYTRRLRDLAEEVRGDQAQPYRGRGGTPALPAQTRGLPAIAIGVLDRNGLVPRSHQASDTWDHVAAGALGEVVELGLLLVDAIDQALESEPTTNQTAITPA
jgi:hypothetical protein